MLKLFPKICVILTALLLTVIFASCGDMFSPPIPLKASFTFNENMGEVAFYNKSEGYDSLRWYFADGKTSTEINPTHTYTNKGVYFVKLRVWQKETFMIHEERIGISIVLSKFPKPSLEVRSDGTWHTLIAETGNIPVTGKIIAPYLEVAHDKDFTELVMDVVYRNDPSFGNDRFYGMKNLERERTAYLKKLEPAKTYYFRIKLIYEYKNYEDRQTVYSEVKTGTTASFITSSIIITGNDDDLRNTYETSISPGTLEDDMLDEEILFSTDANFNETIEMPDHYRAAKYFMQPTDYDLYVKYKVTNNRYPNHIAESVVKVRSPNKAIGLFNTMKGIEAIVKERGEDSYEVIINSTQNDNYVKMSLSTAFSGTYTMFPGNFQPHLNRAVLYVADLDKTYYLRDGEFFVNMIRMGDYKVFYTGDKTDMNKRYLVFEDPDDPTKARGFTGIFR